MKVLKAPLVFTCIFSLTFCLASPSFASNAATTTERLSSDSVEPHYVLALTRDEIDAAFESFLASHNSKSIFHSIIHIHKAA